MDRLLNENNYMTMTMYICNVNVMISPTVKSRESVEFVKMKTNMYDVITVIKHLENENDCSSNARDSTEYSRIE